MNKGAALGHVGSRRQHAGFTLIEALVVIAIVGIFAALAAPSFSNTIANMRIKSTSFDLVNDLNAARSEAIKRNAEVVIVAEGGDWNQGWRLTAGGTTLKAHEAPTGSVAIASAVDAINFQGNGRPDAAATLSITSSLSGVAARCVELQATGSARSLKEACPS